jgi:hypothetical protein
MARRCVEWQARKPGWIVMVDAFRAGIALPSPKTKALQAPWAAN